MQSVGANNLMNDSRMTLAASFVFFSFFTNCRNRCGTL